MTLSLNVAPSALFAVDDAALRQHLRLESGETDADTLLAELIATATADVETYTRRRLMTQEVILKLDRFGRPGTDGTLLPIAPVQSVDAVGYYDESNSYQTLAASDYRLVDSRQPPELWPAFGKTWPVPAREPDVVEIYMTVGYGAASDVPAQLRHAVRMMIAHLDQHREAVMIGSPEELPIGVRHALDPFRLWL